MQPRRWHLRATSVSARPAALDHLGWIALAEGRFAEARELFKEALALTLEIGGLSAPHPARTSRCRRGEHARPRRGSAAAAGSGVHGDTPWGRGQALFERHLAAARAQTDPAEWDAAGGALTIEQAAAEVLGT